MKMTLYERTGVHVSLTLAFVLVCALGSARAKEARTAPPVGRSQYVSVENAEADPGSGALRLEHAKPVIFKEDFGSGLYNLDVINYENKLSIGLNKEGEIGFVFVRGADGDTAFEIGSENFPVQGGAEYELAFRMRSHIYRVKPRGHKDKYHTQIQWFAALNKPCGATPFPLKPDKVTKPAKDKWYELRSRVKAPPEATTARIRFGFDYPDVKPGMEVCFGDIRFFLLSSAKYKPGGTVTLAPRRAAKAGVLSWTVRTPAGTKVRFKVRVASDKNGAPGAWRDPAGPDGKPDSYYTKPGTALPKDCAGKWVQAKAYLATTDPAVTPELMGVEIAGQKNGPWSMADTQAPTVDWEKTVFRTEDPALPIVFSIADNPGGVGLNLQSLRAYFDDKPAKLLPQPGGGYRVDTGGPLDAPVAGADFRKGKIENYGKLKIIRHAGYFAVSTQSRFAGRDTAFVVETPLLRTKAVKEVTFRFKTSSTLDLSSSNVKSFKEYYTALQWFGADGKPIGKPAPFKWLAKKGEWTLNECKFAVPEGATGLKVRFGWDSPNFRKDDVFKVKGFVIDGVDAEPIRTPNMHAVRIEAADIIGNRMIETRYILVKKLPTKNIVTLRDDGMTLIDGKPFFPIGMYSVWKYKHNEDSLENAFRELKEAGFNTAHTYNADRGPDLDKFYALAEKHGMKVFLASSCGANSTDVDTILQDVATECNYPALLSWYIADDTASHISVADLTRVHRAIIGIDPFHPTCQADGIGWKQDPSRYHGYGNATDIILPELYPIHSMEKNVLPNLVGDMKAVAKEFERIGRKRGNWAIVQDFKGWGWKRYPTDTEARVMTYLSIIHGATAMTYYTYGGWGKNMGAPFDKAVWANLKKIAGELARLHDVLVERTPRQTCEGTILEGVRKDDIEGPALNMLLKTHKGKNYLFTANSARGETRCRFKPATLAPAARVEVLFENRTVPVKAGAFEDTFEGYGVHVYTW